MTRFDRFGAAALAALFTAVATQAPAGDAAIGRFLGFSPDGRYAAFEQYGTLDWSDVDSGYAEVAIVDTRTDAFVEGTPIVVEDKREGATLTLPQARKQVAAKAAPLLARLRVRLPGLAVAIDPAAKARQQVAHADIASLLQDPPAPLTLTRDPGGSLMLEPQGLGDPTCSVRFGETEQEKKALGFRLSLRDAQGRSRVLHEDKAVPRSRECPIGYRLAEAWLLARRGNAPVIAVLVARFSQGFEGPDRRFLLVTGVLAP